MESAAYGAGCLRAKAIQYTETQALWGLRQTADKGAVTERKQPLNA